MFERDKIQEAIERLKVMDDNFGAYDVAEAFMGELFNCKPKMTERFRDTLIELLEMACDSVPLPVDADGETIRIGDELCGYGCPDGGVYCQATDGYLILVGAKDIGYRDWLLWMPRECVHVKPVPTVEDMLREFAEKITDSQVPNTHPTCEEVIAEYAERLALKEDVQA